MALRWRIVGFSPRNAAERFSPGARKAAAGMRLATKAGNRFLKDLSFR